MGTAPSGSVQVLNRPARATLTVYDALGRCQRPPAPTLDATGLPPGLYLVRAEAPGQPTQTARLVVE